VEEKRKTDRVKALIFTTVYNHSKNELLGFLGDLTLTGAMVTGEKVFDRGVEMTLRIEFRGTDEIPQSKLIIPSKVAWCKPKEDLNYHNTGFEFTQLSGLNEKIVSMIVERYKFSRDFPQTDTS